MRTALFTAFILAMQFVWALLVAQSPESSLGTNVPNVVTQIGHADADAIGITGIPTAADHELDEGYFPFCGVKSCTESELTLVVKPDTPLWAWLRDRRQQPVEIVFLRVPR